MATYSAKAAAMRARAQKKLDEERRDLSATDKAILPQIRKRLAKKVRSSLPTRQLAHAAA